MWLCMPSVPSHGLVPRIELRSTSRGGVRPRRPHGFHLLTRRALGGMPSLMRPTTPTHGVRPLKAAFERHRCHLATTMCLRRCTESSVSVPAKFPELVLPILSELCLPCPCLSRWVVCKRRQGVTLLFAGNAGRQPSGLKSCVRNVWKWWTVEVVDCGSGDGSSCATCPVVSNLCRVSVSL